MKKTMKIKNNTNINEGDDDKKQDEHEKVMATTNKMNIKKAMALKKKD
jgi:hypothetical protein